MNINNLAEQILRKMPEGLSKLEQARFIYLELGRMVTFDEEYWFGNTSTMRRIYTSAKRVRDFKELKDNRVICVSLSNLYNNLLNKIGIEAFQQEGNEDNPHVFSVINIDGAYYKADLQRDLRFIQARRKTLFFGKAIDSQENEAISEEELRKIDENIGYFYKGEKELENLVSTIRKYTADAKGLEEKMKAIFNFLGQYQDMGYVEKIAYYDYIVRKNLTEKEISKIYENAMYVQQNGRRKYTSCISVRKKDGTFERSMYSEVAGTFLPIEDEKIIELMKEGLQSLRGKKIPGLEKKRKIQDENISL